MNDLDKEFELLQNTIEENSRSEVKNLWLVCFRIFHFYYLLNQKIASAKNLQEQIAITEKFVSFYKDRKTIESEIPKNQKADDVVFDPHLNDILRDLHRERVLFGKNLRRIKAAKTSEKLPPKKPRGGRPKKDKWVKS